MGLGHTQVGKQEGDGLRGHGGPPVSADPELGPAAKTPPLQRGCVEAYASGSGFIRRLAAGAEAR